MLNNNFFQIIHKEVADNHISAAVKIDSGHFIFTGHFPDHPVVPGVCMMQMVKELLEEVTGLPTRLSLAQEMKFLTIINPLESSEVHIEINYKLDDTGNYITHASIKKDTTVYFKFKGIFLLSPSL